VKYSVAEHYQFRSELARSIAAIVTDANTREAMLKTAEAYEALKRAALAVEAQHAGATQDMPTTRRANGFYK
jgi:hypothetical protein